MTVRLVHSFLAGFSTETNRTDFDSEHVMFSGRPPVICSRSQEKFFLSHPPIMLFPYLPGYLQVAFLPKVHTDSNKRVDAR